VLVAAAAKRMGGCRQLMVTRPDCKAATACSRDGASGVWRSLKEQEERRDPLLFSSNSTSSENFWDLRDLANLEPSQTWRIHNCHPSCPLTLHSFTAKLMSQPPQAPPPYPPAPSHPPTFSLSKKNTRPLVNCLKHAPQTRLRPRQRMAHAPPQSRHMTIGDIHMLVPGIPATAQS